MSSSVSFPPNGDYIGTESCINDLLNYDGFDDINGSRSPNTSNIGARKQANSRKKKEKREFPPPIPLLARTQNLSSHMPWELKRYYTSDGRLILREEKVRHHHYFRAHRANGRLTLQLVPLDPLLDTYSLSYYDDDTREVEAEATSPPQTDDGETYNDSTDQDSPDRFRDDGPDTVADGLPLASPNGTTKCNLNFTRVSSAPSCLFKMPVHPIRTVHG